MCLTDSTKIPATGIYLLLEMAVQAKPQQPKFQPLEFTFCSKWRYRPNRNNQNSSRWNLPFTRNGFTGQTATTNIPAAGIYLLLEMAVRANPQKPKFQPMELP
jgi:hypothetical protein